MCFTINMYIFACVLQSCYTHTHRMCMCACMHMCKAEYNLTELETHTSLWTPYHFHRCVPEVAGYFVDSRVNYLHHMYTLSSTSCIYIPKVSPDVWFKSQERWQVPKWYAICIKCVEWSRLTVLLSHVILNEWLAFLESVLNIHWSGALTALFGCYMAGACMFSCNLPPALLVEWPGFSTCYCGNRGRMDTKIRVSMESWPWRRKFYQTHNLLTTIPIPQDEVML